MKNQEIFLKKCDLEVIKLRVAEIGNVMDSICDENLYNTFDIQNELQMYATQLKKYFISTRMAELRLKVI